MDLGADLCCDSAHKTLPVLTGGGYLHISAAAPVLLAQQADAAMALFSTTSPSYLILQSLDAVNARLDEDYPPQLQAFVQEVALLKQHLQQKGFALLGHEPLKLTLSAKPLGYTGDGLADFLAASGMVCEFSDPDYIVLMLTPELGSAALAQLEQQLSLLPRKAPILQAPPALPHPQPVCTLRQALFSPAHDLPTDACCGKVLAQASIACPPAIPVVVCGERLDTRAIACLEYYGIHTCRVMD